jgi:hypothetical protein
MRRPALLSTLSIAALAAQSLGLASPALAGTPNEVAFAYTGGEQHFDVPTDIASIHVALIGGHGGGGAAAAGHGAHVEGDLGVIPGQRLYVEVGGNGADGNPSTPTAGGFNGGAAGGINGQVGFFAGSGAGASDVRSLPRSDSGSLDSRLMVAAGAGGSGLGPGANGGDAEQAGQGANAGGGAGTSSSGGSAGAGIIPGQAGTFGIGGAGSTGTNGGGGGGGAGYYGGGGGADTNGGGGGGSNFIGAATNTTASIDTSGTPSITISYGAGGGSNTGTVNAQFSVPTSAACIELSSTSIDFGSVRLGDANVPATPDVTVTNCAGESESILAHGSDAAASGSTWALVAGSATCADTLGLDNYRMALESSSATVDLSTSNATIGSLAGGDTSTQTARMWAACPGSTGSGQLMTTQITFLATEGG